MGLIDFPNPPLVVGQDYAAPNGAIYEWDGEVWTAQLTPGTGGGGTAFPIGPAGGDLTGTYPNPVVVKASTGLTVPVNPNAVVIGAGPSKSRLAWGTSPVRAEWRVNVNAADAMDDPTKPAMALFMEPGVASVRWTFQWAPAGASVGLWSMPFWFEVPSGFLGIQAFSGNAIVMGGQASKARVLCGADVATNGLISLRTNRNFTNVVDDVTQPSWKFDMGGPVVGWDAYNIARSAAAGPVDWKSLFTIKSDGQIQFGDTLIRGTLRAWETDGHQVAAALVVNDPLAPQDLTKSSWAIEAWPTPGDCVRFLFRNANDPADTLQEPFLFTSDGNIITKGSKIAMAEASTLQTVGGAFSMIVNSPLESGNNPGKPSWKLALANFYDDQFQVLRNNVPLMYLDAAGKLYVEGTPVLAPVEVATKVYVDTKASKWSIAGTTISPLLTTLKTLGLPGDATTGATVLLGTQAAKTRLQAYNNFAAWLSVSINTDTIVGGQDNVALPSWEMMLRADTDKFVVRHKGPGGAFPDELLVVDGSGRVTVTIGPTNALDLATKGYVDSKVTGLSGDLSGALPNPQLAAGVIVDADVNAAANIAGSKLLAKSVDGLRLTKSVYGRVYRTAVLNLPSAVTTYLTFAGIAANYTASPGCTWSAGQPTRLTCAEAGIYAIGAGFSLAGAATVVHALIYKNAALILAGLTCPSPGYFNMFALAEMNANDFLEVTFLPNAAISIDSTYLTANLYAVRIG